MRKWNFYQLEIKITICSKCIFVICTQLDFASISFFANIKNIYKIFVSSYFRMFIPKSVILNQKQNWLLYRLLSRDHSRAWVVIFIIYSVVSVYKLYMLIILDKNEYNYTKITSCTLLRPVEGMKRMKTQSKFQIQNGTKFLVNFRVFSDLSNLSSTTA